MFDVKKVPHELRERAREFDRMPTRKRELAVHLLVVAALIVSILVHLHGVAKRHAEIEAGYSLEQRELLTTLVTISR